jgi:hypothetical protein
MDDTWSFVSFLPNQFRAFGFRLTGHRVPRAAGRTSGAAPHWRPSHPDVCR